MTLVGSPARFAAGIEVLGGMPGADPGSEMRTAARLELVDLVAAVKLQVFVDGTYHVRGAVALIP